MLLMIAITFGLIALGVWLRLFMSYGKPHEVSTLAPPGEPPSQHPPAILSYLFYRSAYGGAVVATLMDLAHRGYFEIRERREEKSGWFGSSKVESNFFFERTAKDLSELTPYESDLVSFLLTKAGSSRGFSMNGLKEAAKSNRTAFRKWFMGWNKRVKAAGKRQKFYEEYEVRPMVLNALMGVGIAVVGIFLCIYNDSAVGVPAVVGGLLQAVLTAGLTRHTPEGRRLSLEWRAFKKHLQSITRRLGPVRLDSQAWSRYLAAALLFGMHKKLLPHLEIVSDDGRATAYPRLVSRCRAQ